ncbi:hypothetical protein [Thioclava sp. DLFJ4-1]|uniref:hypothetical protein n=1 Tax=Thioclava sp. DLFJ4-1 TaxID=1915313 RepID=UPI0009C9158D|nr:hypothetical protein [Thioclava sp. DLFJ4-1]OOY14497.1 hypothetical protein BMI85_20340 [Thioclava sp. DLFJ4-1]
MTKTIINGKIFDTATATEIGCIGSTGGLSVSDFWFWEATLYRSPKGNYFMEGEGGARSPFAQPYNTNGWIGSAGIVALSPEDALAYAEKSLSSDTLLEHFADHLTEG